VDSGNRQAAVGEGKLKKLAKIAELAKAKVTPLDYLHKKDRGKLNIGWCSYFPPSENGVAAATYSIANALNKMAGFSVYAIPADGLIDRSLFPNMKVAKIDDKELDAVIFFCLGEKTINFVEKSKSKNFVWQTVHEPPLTDKSEKQIFEQLKKFENVFLVSKWATKEYNKAGVKAKYLPIAVDINKFVPRRNESFEVLFVSRIHHFKGVITFLKTIPHVLRNHSHVKFRLHAPIDRFSPHLHEILSEIEKAKKAYPNNFLFEESWIDYDEMPKKYANSSVLVFPSASEGFGVPLIEAMSCGIPCIVADKKPMNEIIENNKTGFCLPQRERIHDHFFPSAEEISEKINYLFENKSVFEKMQRNARQKAEKEYSRDAVLEKLVKELSK